MTNVNHQVNWHALVSSGRAKAHGVNWTDEEWALIRSGEKTVAVLREAFEVEKAEAVIASNKKTSKAKKAAPVAKKEVSFGSKK